MTKQPDKRQYGRELVPARADIKGGMNCTYTHVGLHVCGADVIDEALLEAVLLL